MKDRTTLNNKEKSSLIRFDNIFLYINLINIFKNESKICRIIRKNRKTNMLNIKINKNHSIKSYNNKNENIKNTIIIILISSLMMKIFCQKNSIVNFDLIFYHDSKIILKMKGIGENRIFGNSSDYVFKSISHLKNVYINGNKQDTIKDKYHFNQTDNYVELIFEDNIQNCDNLFRKCYNIIEIELSYFNTSQVTNMVRMFSYCTSLISINLSNFDTSNAKHMEYMFYNCISLTSLNLSNFITSKVVGMYSMFYNCSSLTTLNLSNFDTKKVNNMNNMFYRCSSITSLDLSNFNTEKVTHIQNMFYGCINLEYINLKNFNEKNIDENITYYKNMFYNIPINAIICINENSTKSKIFPQIKNKNCIVIDCTDDWKSKQKKIIINTNECIESCDNSFQNQYEYNGKCYENCQKGVLAYNNIKNKTCKCELDECLLCPNVALNKRLCTQCNINYYPKENDFNNIGEYINCYKELDGYYLDNNIYKKCFYTCKICNISGNNKNHNCIECSDDYSFKIKNRNSFNCYETCSYYYYFDNKNNYHCTINSTCPKNYPKLIEEKKECVINDIKDIIDDAIKEKNETEIIEDEFTENYDTSKIDNGEDEVIKTEKITVTFTTSENQKNNINNNQTTIDLGECENLLRIEYNISPNETLYMKKMDIVQQGMKTSKVEYDVYCKLFGTNLIKLNLTVCEKSKISIFMPFIITDNVDKYNTSSGYYNDICYTTTSEDGTDITLKDRKTNYIDGDKIICQEDCQFTTYDSEKSKAECLCNVKETPSTIANMNINKEKILDNFINIKNIANLNFLVCYKKLLCKKGILNNIGSNVMLAINFFHIITLIIFYLYSFTSLKEKIKNIRYIVFKEENSKKITYQNVHINETLTSKIKINKKRKKLKNKRKSKELYQIKKFNKITTEFKDEELNTLPYNLAILYDKRKYCGFYASLLKTQHNFINSFMNNNDYNSKIIKIDLFIIGFAIEYTVNGLFYTDDTMHEIYESKGQFDYKTQIPIIVYSTFISMILNAPLNFLALSNDAILNFKRSNIKNNIKEKAQRLRYILSIKFFIYFIISFLFLAFFWYYISMFGVIYRNTQTHLLKDTVMSFGLSLLFPFVYYLLPGIFRISALTNSQKKRECLYDFSKFLQWF